MDYTSEQLNTVKQALTQRWPQEIELMLADVEIRCYPDDRELTPCPALTWSVDGYTFVIIKTSETQFKNVFYDSTGKQFGSGIEVYDDLHTCTITLMQVQADFMRKQANI